MLFTVFTFSSLLLTVQGLLVLILTYCSKLNNYGVTFKFLLQENYVTEFKVHNIRNINISNYISVYDIPLKMS
jgi:hypothetical protein